MLSYSCTNKCNFCLELKNRSAKEFNRQPFSLDQIIKFFKKNHKKYESVFITGGEPTLYPDFLDVISVAKKYGCRVHLNTNGVLFASSAFTLKVIPFIDEIIISVHGHNARLHDHHTNNPGSFKTSIRGLQNIINLSSGIDLLVNVVVTKLNFKYLTSIISYLHSAGAQRILLSNMVPVNSSDDFARNGMVRLRDWYKKSYILFDLANKLDIDLKVFGVPPCIITDFIDNKDDFGIESEEKYDRVEYRDALFSITKIDRSTPIAIKPKVCRVCKKKKACKGLFRQYYKTYGDVELRPFT